jgi:hypothetical protein
VRVDDIDPQGKVSLTPVDADGQPFAGSGGGSREREAVGARSESRSESRGADSGATTASFEEFFEEEAAKEFGDLGPAEAPSGGGGDRGERGDRNGGGRRGGPRRRR